MGVPIADIHKRASSVGGLPVCTFEPASFRRIITTIVVGNSAASNVKVYKGTMDSLPIAQNPVGADNTLTGRLVIPPGQPFYVRWSAVGASVTDAFARVSMERDDNPLGDVITALTLWLVNAVTSITIPSTAGPTDPRIEIGATIPADLQARYNENPPNETIRGGIFFYQGTDAYTYLVMTTTNVGSSVRMCLGTRGTSGNIHEWVALMVFGGGAVARISRLTDDLNSLIETEFHGSNVEFFGTSTSPFNPQINMNDGVNLQVRDTCNINVFDTGEIRIWGTPSGDDGRLQTDAGSTVQIDGDITISSLRHQYNSQASVSTTSSTSYGNLTNIAGVSFTAPQSGIVSIIFSGLISNNSAAGGVGITPWIGTGSTVGSGTEVVAASDANAAAFTQHATASEPVQTGIEYQATGLTPGTVYNISIRARSVSAGTASIQRIKTLVIPSP